MRWRCYIHCRTSCNHDAASPPHKIYQCANLLRSVGLCPVARVDVESLKLLGCYAWMGCLLVLQSIDFFNSTACCSCSSFTVLSCAGELHMTCSGQMSPAASPDSLTLLNHRWDQITWCRLTYPLSDDFFYIGQFLAWTTSEHPLRD